VTTLYKFLEEMSKTYSTDNYPPLSELERQIGYRTFPKGLMGRVQAEAYRAVVERVQVLLRWEEKQSAEKEAGASGVPDPEVQKPDHGEGLPAVQPGADEATDAGVLHKAPGERSGAV